MVALHTELPIIADADTGFGGPLDISRTVRLYEHAGIAGLHIEDQVMAGSRSRCALICMDAQSHQVFPKRCGQLQGKDVVALEVFIERVRSAVEARQDPDFVIIARTDARQAKKFGGPHAGSEAFHEGIKRLKAAVAAGADMVFMGSPRTEDECRTLVKEMGDVPVPINVLPNVSKSGFEDTSRYADRTVIMVSLPTSRYQTESAGLSHGNLPVYRIHSGDASYATVVWCSKSHGTDHEACEGHTIKDFFDQVGLGEAGEFDARISECSKTQTGEKGAQEGS
ncbi:hypothetical protein LV164_008119 [Aspergillus fumigatus]|nr:hypothetical protein KXX42_004396 [Aspergillus fumigatus]KAH1984275.1 hypothetical protein KXW88_002137 [Aspergillus fumigatus]KAH2309111.1 hypothetical protein KXV47_005906 [Aspergillus fumigatus]KAH2659491.1 hypothetical protein KXV32_001416 [Aspergillus fumigatus]KAH2748378.1 hypothetical protein KXV94_004453 [Aspergillus fumigatus]